jgi:hypothetical protein
MFKVGSHDPFGRLKHKLWPKERSRVKLAIWLLTTKSRKSTWFPYVQVAWDMSLESSWRGLQICLKTHLNRRFVNKFMGPQSRKSPNFGNLDVSFGTKCHLDVGFVKKHIVYYKGKVAVSPKFGPWWVLWVQVCLWLVLTPKMF